MSITRLQQARQMMNEGGPMRKIRGQDHMLAYITPSEKDILVELGGRETMTPEGILAYPPEGNYGSEAKGPGSGPGPSGITGMGVGGGNHVASGGTGQVSGPDSSHVSSLQDYNHKVATGTLSDEDYETIDEVPLNKREQAFQNFLDYRKPVKTYGLSRFFQKPIQTFSDFTASVNRPFFEKVIRAGKIPGLNFDMTQQQFEDAYQRYMSNRLAGKTDAYGNPMQGFEYGDDGLTGRFQDNGGGGGGIMDVVVDDTTTDDGTTTDDFFSRYLQNQPEDVRKEIEARMQNYYTV